MNGVTRTGLALAIVAGLNGCGGGGSDSSLGKSSGSGDLTLKITDAPVDGAEHVWITITGVTLKRSGSDQEQRIDVTGNEIEVDLLSLSNGTTLPLFTESVTAGEYQWARFQISDARIEWINGGMEDLQLPTQDELKTSGNFSVPRDGVANYTVDWDLRKSIVEVGSSGNYKLKPVLHLRDDDNVGFIQGHFDETYLSTECAGETNVPAVYLYFGHSIIPDDMGGAGTEPMASVKLDTSNDFYIGMLNPGNYTLAFTCDGDLDEPETDELQSGAIEPVVEFLETLEVTVVQGENVEFEDADYPFEDFVPAP